MENGKRVYGVYIQRCKGCGNLLALHNAHCCEFCMIPDCKCENGVLEDDRGGGI